MKHINKTIFFLPNDQFARFEHLARTLAEADFGVPARYRGNFGSCLNAVDIAYRLGVSPLVVLQNTYDIDGQQVWSYHFVKVLIEASGLINGEIEYESLGTPGDEDYRVRAKATRVDGKVLEGTWITWQMAKLEGWLDNISYTSMPEVMMCARATTFLGNRYFDGLLLGVSIDHDAGKTTAAAATPTGKVATNGGLIPASATDSPPGDDATTTNTSVFASALAQTPTGVAPVAAAPAPVVAPEPGQGATGEAKPARKTRIKAEPAPAPEPGATPPALDLGITKASLADSSKGQVEEEATAPAVELAALATGKANGTDNTVSPATGKPKVEPGTAPAAPTDENKQEAMALKKQQSAQADDRFSNAFAMVDKVSRTAESLQEAMEIVKAFEDLTERSDLYLVLLGVVERHMLAMATKQTPFTKSDKDFAGLARTLHTDTKPYAESAPELATKRVALGEGYKAFLKRVTAQQQA